MLKLKSALLSLSVSALAIALFFPGALFAADESITVTTYYPSPYGVYREMRAQRMAVGDNYVSGSSYCWGGTCTNTIDTDADLVVEGNVGIGTVTPGAKLSVVGGDVIVGGTSRQASLATGTSLFELQDHYLALYSPGAPDQEKSWGIQASSAGQFLFQTYPQGKGTIANWMVVDRTGTTVDTVSFPSGNVGIGMSSPAAKLHVAGGDWTATSLSDAWNTPIARFRVASATYDGYLLLTDVYGGYTPALQSASSASTARNLTLNPFGGNVGVGTTTPAYPLDIKGADTDNAILARFYSNTGSRGSFGIRNGTTTNPTTYIGTLGGSEQLAIGTVNAERIRINASGYVGIANTSPGYLLTMEASGGGYYSVSDHSWHNGSSIRWKENIKPIPNALQLIMKLQGVYFKWKPKYGGSQDIGFIAEDVGKVLPQVVSYDPKASGFANGMDYSKITALLVEGVKEQQKEIEGLKAEIASLKFKIAEK
ncbi:MAG: tail fiber domain-containing protein [Candidatus Omnitrophica bacterium]|nr:tail fiber domain-containing protein [Candidatus Omnitrophota bacterium]